MTQEAQRGVPTWTVGDRLRKAREVAQLSQAQMAEEIGISRRSVSTYEAAGKPPRKPVLISWSIRTGVPMTWILTGRDGPGPDGGLPRLDSNQKPTGSRRAALAHTLRRVSIPNQRIPAAA